MSFHVINAKNLAPSEYTGLSLLGLDVHDGRLYGISASGLIEFAGTDDEGVDVDAYTQTGKMDFGGGELKRFPRLYLGGSADGGLSVDVATEEVGTETTRTYPVTLWSGSLRERRVKLARGPMSRHVQVKVANVDGGSMVIERADLLVEGLVRRV